MTAKESFDNNKSELPDSGKGLPAGRPGKDEDMAGAIRKWPAQELPIGYSCSSLLP